MPELILSRRAALDIAVIEDDSIRRWGQAVANSYLDSIDNALQLVSDNPGLLRKFANSEQLLFYPVRKHSLFCTLYNDVIYVLTVRYGGMDLERLIHELEPFLLEEVEIMHRKLGREAP
ncbi:MAG: type II toxin-antitoxin system RelE/ParE family toxin [Thiolinea sp.]